MLVEMPLASQIHLYRMISHLLNDLGITILQWMLYQGSGVGGAKVLIDGKQQTTTGPDGMYHLENMKTGTYRIQVQKEHMSFDEITVKITPNTPQIQDIIASGFVITGILLDIEYIVCKGRKGKDFLD